MHERHLSQRGKCVYIDSYFIMCERLSKVLSSIININNAVTFQVLVKHINNAMIQ